MNIEVRWVTPQLWAVIADGTKWRRFRMKSEALRFAADLKHDPIIFKSDLESMKHQAHCSQCGATFEYIAGTKNSTSGSYPDFNEWPRCPACNSYTHTRLVKETS